MTIEELLEFPIEKLEQLSDKELEEVFKPYFSITRPEVSSSLSSNKKVTKDDIETKLKMQKAKELAKKFGFDL